MKLNFKRNHFLMAAVLTALSGCVSSYIRLPSSASQVYSNQDVRQVLALVAENNVMIHIPEATTREFEKTEIDRSCSRTGDPLWSDKLSVYLNEFRKKPELLSRLHVIEVKRGDNPDVVIHRDLDGAVTVTVQFVKFENYGKVSFQTAIPCKGSVSEYLGRNLIKTDYEFPDVKKFSQTLQALPERKNVPRFEFSREFPLYLAERGAIFKFSHELSFERTAQGKYVMAELLNKFGEEIKEPFHQHMNYWFRQINRNSTQAQLIQMFAIYPDKDLKAGVRVDSVRDSSPSQKVVIGDTDVTYLYLTYNVENDRVISAGLQDLERCLQGFTENMSAMTFRKPASVESQSYLKPGYSCRVGTSEAILNN